MICCTKSNVRQIFLYFFLKNFRFQSQAKSPQSPSFRAFFQSQDFFTCHILQFSRPYICDKITGDIEYVSIHMHPRQAVCVFSANRHHSPNRAVHAGSHWIIVKEEFYV